MQGLGLGRLECGSQLDLDVVDVRRGWEKQEETSERMKGSTTSSEYEQGTQGNDSSKCVEGMLARLPRLFCQSTAKAMYFAPTREQKNYNDGILRMLLAKSYHKLYRMPPHI